MFKFGKRSEIELATCHPDLQLIARESLKNSQVDFGITKGHRSTTEQLKLYAKGKSQIDGITKLSMHNYTPSLAFDIYAYVSGKPHLGYDPLYLSHIAGIIIATANELYKEGKISDTVIWGFNWDGDNEIGTDQIFQDMPHFQLGKTL